jgi:hypothetical protein
MANTPNDNPEPSFVFTGTVRKLGASTMKAVAADARTAVVRVDQVVEAQPAFTHVAGSDITVQLAGRARVAVGQQLIFHAVGWIFGDSIAVRALSQQAVTRSHTGLLSRGGAPAEHAASRTLQQRVDAADLVVSGQVVAVHVPDGDQPRTRAAMGAVPVSTKPVSEHDPKWREAVIAVDDVHKGEHGGGQVRVLFPSSRDVRWFKAPKFEAGQQGTFMLHKGAMKPSERVGARGRDMSRGAPDDEAEVPVYTALHPMDYQPPQQHERVRSALAAGNTGKGS